MVVRYSGGIKLGAGGLIRAYGGAARDALADADKMEIIANRIITLSLPSANVGDVYSLCASHEDGVVLKEDFKANAVIFTVSLREENTDDFKDAISDRTRGAVQFLEPPNSE